MAEQPRPPGPGQAAANLLWAGELVRGLVAGGVRRAVLSPGSRSAPLAVAFSRCPHLETFVLPDERSAAFLALGMARASGLPVAVVATSGSAVANWYPAVIEASADDVPLVLVSADRPPELQQTAANQTIDQSGIFAGFPRAAFQLPPPPGHERLPASTGLRAAEAARWPRPGPVHVNAAFREPLAPAPDDWPGDWPAPVEPAPPPAVAPDDQTVDRLAARLADGPGVIVCGRTPARPRYADAVATLARALDCPVVADPLSGLRWGGHDRSRVLTSADLFLRGRGLPGGRAPEWLLQLGRPPVSRAVLDWMSACGAPLLTVLAAGPWPDPSHASAACLRAEPGALAWRLADRLAERVRQPDWLEAWTGIERRAEALRADAGLAPPEAALVRALETTLAPEARLFAGNSMLIRSVDAFCAGRDAPLALYGNRGASGIDGNVATACGLTDPGMECVALLGDLALYHDMNGLLATRERPLKLLVVNNGGGGIFETMPYGEHPDFDRLWLTPTGLDPARIAALYDLPHHRFAAGEAAAELPRALEGDGPLLAEAVVDRPASTRAHKALWAEASALVGDSP